MKIEIRKFSTLIIFSSLFVIFYYFSPQYKMKSRVVLESFNVQDDCDANLNHAISYSKWNNRKDDVIDVLSFPEADILCLQSVSNRSINYIKSKLNNFKLAIKSDINDDFSCISNAIFYNGKKLVLDSTYYLKNSLNIPISVSKFNHKDLKQFSVINMTIPEDMTSKNILTIIDYIKPLSNDQLMLCISSNKVGVEKFLIDNLNNISLKSSYHNFISSRNNKRFFTYKEKDNSSPLVLDFIFSNMDNVPRRIPLLHYDSVLPSEKRGLPSNHIFLVSDFGN